METIERLRKNFEANTLEQNLAFLEGNGKKANRIQKKILKLREETELLGLIDVFEDFLYSKNENTRLWASCFCLKTQPDLAKKNLIELTHSSEPIIALGAKFKLESLKKGE